MKHEEVDGDEIEGDDDVPSANPTRMRAMLRQFAHNASPSRLGASPGGTRTTTNFLRVKAELSDTPDVKTKSNMSLATKNRKRGSPEDVDSSCGPSPKRKKAVTKRTYAPPEQYEHLKHLTDFLKPGLEVVICGINPGIMSSTSGHQFANPTNHFWKCLHQSGLTDCFVPPSEDQTLPDRFSIGMTNLIHRPSAEAAELSQSEMREGVIPLLEKLCLYKPKFVCIVGKTIWNAVSSVIEKDLQVSYADDRDHKKESAEPVTSPSKKKGKRKRIAKPDFAFGLQPYKLLHPIHDEPPQPTAAIGSSDELLTDVSTGLGFTLFWVVPSTSGKVVSYQLPDKVKLFHGLKVSLDQLNSGILDTSRMREVRVPASKIRQAQEEA